MARTPMARYLGYFELVIESLDFSIDADINIFQITRELIF